MIPGQFTHVMRIRSKPLISTYREEPPECEEPTKVLPRIWRAVSRCSRFEEAESRTLRAKPAITEIEIDGCWEHPHFSHLASSVHADHHIALPLLSFLRLSLDSAHLR